MVLALQALARHIMAWGCFYMSRKPFKPKSLRRVGGLAMMCMAAGMMFAWFFLGFSFFLAILLVVGGFYLLFM